MSILELEKDIYFLGRNERQEVHTWFEIIFDKKRRDCYEVLFAFL